MTSCADDYWDGVPCRCPRLRGGQTPTQIGSEPVADYRKWSKELIPRSLARLSFGPASLGPVRQIGRICFRTFSDLKTASSDSRRERSSVVIPQPSFRIPKSAISDPQSPE